MKITRRQFVILGVGVAGGCTTANEGGPPAAQQARTVNAGPASNYATDGVYAAFRDQGFFVVRQGDKLFAISAICTHRKCTLTGEADRSFFCKCHGSTFDAGGHVTKGPAKRDLAVLSAERNEAGELVVFVPAK